MILGFSYPFLRIFPEGTEATTLGQIPWALPAGDGTFTAYWTYLETVQAHFGVYLRFDPSIEKLRPLLAVKSDLSHLPTWDRTMVSRYFFDSYKPRDYQADGIYYLMRAKRVLVADATGLGKTVQSAGAVALHGLVNEGQAVVICPSGLRYQWRREICAMFTKGNGEPMYGMTDFVVIDGTPAHRRALYATRTRPVPWVIMSYELLLRDLDAFDGWLAAMGSTRAVIIDESSRCKNATTATFEKVLELLTRQNPELVYLLNATPVENRLEDLWSQLRLVCPWIFPSWNAFEAGCITKLTFQNCRKCGHYSCERSHFQTCKGRGGYPWRPNFEKVVGYKNLPQVKQLIRDRFIRRDYSDVDEQLPAMVVSNYMVELGAEQRRAYAKVEEDETLDPRAKYGELLRRALFETKGSDKVISAKLDALPSVLAEIGDAKAVLVCESKEFVLAVAAALKKEGWHVATITGDVGVKERDEIEREFTLGKTQIIVGTAAIERGRNFQVAGWVINLDLPWNPAKWIQRVGRVRRINARHAEVRVINMIARKTKEEDVLQVVYQKLGVFNYLFEGEVTDETFGRRIDLAGIVKRQAS